MEYKFIIEGKLPSLNEYIRAMNTNRYRGAQLKKCHQDTIYYAILQQLHGVVIKVPVEVEYTFYESNKKRDMDNISGLAHKVVHDALQQAGVIKNDNWGGIKGIKDSFCIDKKNPRIEVRLHD